MVRPRSDSTAGGGFFVDDEEDMEDLLKKAEQAGSTATEDTDGDTGVDFGVIPDEPEVTQPAAADTKQDIDDLLNKISSGRDLTEIDSTLAEFEEEPQVVFKDEIPDAPQDVAAEEPAWTDPVTAPVETPIYDQRRTEPVYVPEPVVEPTPVKTNPTPQPVEQAAPKPDYVEDTRRATPTHIAPTPKTMSTDDQIRLAQRVVKVTDVYRSLTDDSRDIVAQLLAPTPEDVTQEEGTVAIRAIYADPLQQATQEAMIQAKQASPVDRVFYVLGLDKNVLRYLGDLVHAYTQEALPSSGGELVYAKALVEAIDKLGREPLIYAEAVTKVLDAAQA